jgi:hypothetical protein
MKRGAPMKRTEFKRSRREGPALDKGEHPRAKEAKPAKERECICGAKFIPRRMEHVVCSPRCLIRKRKEDAKAERESFKARKEKLKTVTEWEGDCLRIVQKIARIRDRNDGCISCHVGPNYQGRWNGSHFAASAPARTPSSTCGTSTRPAPSATCTKGGTASSTGRA